jgi:A/G-specific adenine glycosylase
MSVDPSVEILRWYDPGPRPLPWRAEGGERPDPYRVWLSEIMLQQTTVAAVRPYFEKFTSRWPTIEALAGAEESELMAAWAGLGYYARARNLHACARHVASAHGARFPETEAELLKLPGIGRYTAAALVAIAFGRRAVVVDGNVERVVSRLFAVEEPLPAARPRLHALTDRITPAERAGDFAQAMMDLGRTICTPRRPKCGSCPLSDHCIAFREQRQEEFPRKRAKRPKPQREGFAYWLEHGEHVLLVRRPAKGLLGGMLALPTGPWAEEAGSAEGAPAAAAWQEVGSVDHVFTHFGLRLRVMRAEAVGRSLNGIWWPVDRIEEAGLPTVFAKAAARARQAALPLLGQAA